jgi:hypothetical protein
MLLCSVNRDKSTGTGKELNRVLYTNDFVTRELSQKYQALYKEKNME